MRKLMITLAAAGAALAVATPAAAQYYPQPNYGYGNNGYGYNGYGYNNYGQVRQLQYRIDSIQRQIRHLDRRDRIGDRSADRLRQEARNIEYRLRNAARYGLNPQEAYDIERRIGRLEQRVHWAMNGRGGRHGYNGYYGQGSYGYDRDRDGRDDRYENDRGYDHDD